MVTIETTNETMAMWMSFKDSNRITIQRKNGSLVYYCEFKDSEMSSIAQTTWNTFDEIEPHRLTRHAVRLIKLRIEFRKKEKEEEDAKT